jgi:exopolysaccharide biosynthesis polyprenyl glycosylphosphotransferase
MNKLSSQAVEAGPIETAPPGPLAAPDRAERVWPRRGTRAWRFALLRRMLALADLTAGLLASIVLLLVGSGQEPQAAWSLVFLPMWIFVAKILGLYDRDQRPLRHLTVDEAPQLVLWALIGTSSLSFFLELTPAGRPSAASAVVAGTAAAVSISILRALARRSWRAATPPQRLAVIGPGRNVAAMKRKLELFPDLHLTLVGERDDLDPADSLEWLRDVDRLVYAPSSLDEHQTRAVIDVARDTGVGLNVVPPCHSIFGSAVRLDHMAELPVLSYGTGDLSRSTLLLKRALDITVSVAALALLWPVFLIVALAIKLDSRGPVLFSQLRAGQGGRPFRMRKFRSMVSNAPELLPDLVSFDSLHEPMFKIRDDPRVTRVGRFLRRWSLDELPQLWNVLIGEMSVVGPRPEEVGLVERYAPEHRIRLVLRPGLTGPMQVFGRGQLTFPERLALECDYIENLSLGRDIYILVLTIVPVLNGRGAY